MKDLVDGGAFAEASRSVLSFDSGAIQAVAAGGDGPIARWAEAMGALLDGDPNTALTTAEALERGGQSARDPILVIEAAALRATATAAMGDLVEATALARRTSRMARTEAIPEQEYTAHLTLARIRRLTGHPHLATRILTSIARVAPPRFQPWLAWELSMAGAFDGARAALAASPPCPAHRAAALLAQLLESAEAADSARFRACSEEAAAAIPWPLFSEEVEAIVDACDPTLSPRQPSVAAWCRGHTTAAPASLHGVFTRKGSAPPGEAAIAYVMAHPAAPGRRLPRMGWGFVDQRGMTVLPQGRRKQGRNETLVSALALAGPDGMSEADAFREVYGFEYELETHRGVFGVCVHRARDYLADGGAIEHGGGRVSLTLLGPLLVPDPRCAKPMQDRLLRAIATRGGSTAQEVAKAIGVSLRVAQQALADLSADGACLATKEGRKVRYEVEDTTFSEPTVHE